MRFPVASGIFYPSDPGALRELIEACFNSPLASGMPAAVEGRRAVRGAMVPHAGYVYSGPRAADAFRRIAEDGRPDAYVVIGPDHRGVCAESVLCGDSYCTPFGEVPVHGEICDRLVRLIRNDPRIHANEHSIEVELPFIQYIDPDARIVPIMMGDQSLRAARALADRLGEACEGFDTVVIASTDMTHYLPKEEVARLDSAVLDRIRGMDWAGMYREIAERDVSMCGYGPTAVAMMMSEGCIAEGVSHSDSSDTGIGDASAVVGYASAVFSRP